MRVLLIQLDGKLPNIALMRIAAHYRHEEVVFRQAGNYAAIDRGLFDAESYDLVYASLIFTSTRPLAYRVQEVYPNSIVGGTGFDEYLTLEHIGIPTNGELDYSIYPRFHNSIGFTQRGCRLRCPFCVVPKKEGGIRDIASPADIWRGEGYPRNLLLLDNDFFGQDKWQKKIDDIRSGNFKVCFTQGINARMLTNETAAAIASVKYYDNRFQTRRIYTAWDSRKDERRLFAGLEALVRHGVKPDHIMVYMLIGYWPGETPADREYRRARLREFGARPYPMPYTRTAELVGFQRFVIGAYDKRISWKDWEAARYQPSNLNINDDQISLWT